MVKYTGGWTLGPAAVGPFCAFDDRLLGDRLCRGYGKGVLASGVWVYEARYSRSIIKLLCQYTIRVVVFVFAPCFAPYLGCTL